MRWGRATRFAPAQESRAELTFSDLTITRLGANTVFSFDESRHEVHLDSGALLLSVPRDGAAARINSAAATAAISGGTALYESNPGFPTKFMVLEGLGNFCSKKDPTDCVDVPAGEMVLMTPDGKIHKTKFNVATVYHTAKLLTDFPELPNADLIQQVIDLQGENPPRVRSIRIRSVLTIWINIALRIRSSIRLQGRPTRESSGRLLRSVPQIRMSSIRVL